MLRKTILFATLLTTFCLLTASAEASQTKQNIVIKMGHYTDDLHSVTMALKIGQMLSEAGADVILFLNLEAVRLVDRRQTQELAWGTSPKIAKLFQKADKSGVKFLVCPHCAKAAGIEVKHLRKPATLGNKKTIAAMFLEADKIMDY